MNFGSLSTQQTFTSCLLLLLLLFIVCPFGIILMCFNCHHRYRQCFWFSTLFCHCDCSLIQKFNCCAMTAFFCNLSLLLQILCSMFRIFIDKNSIDCVYSTHDSVFCKCEMIAEKYKKKTKHRIWRRYKRTKGSE